MVYNKYLNPSFIDKEKSETIAVKKTSSLGITELSIPKATTQRRAKNKVAKIPDCIKCIIM